MVWGILEFAMSRHHLIEYRAISMMVFTLKPQAHMTRPKGKVGNYKFILAKKELLISCPLVIRSV